MKNLKSPKSPDIKPHTAITIAHHLRPGWLAPLGTFTANFYVFFTYRLIGKPRNTRGNTVWRDFSAWAAVLNAGFPAQVTGVERGVRVWLLIVLIGPLAAARHVLSHSKDCKILETEVIKLISEKGCLETARSNFPDQRPTIRIAPISGRVIFW